MKKLPISDEPYIRTYTEYAYVDMIMNNEETNGDLMLHAHISEEFDENWMIDCGNADIELKNSDITIKESYKAPPKVKHVYRIARPADEIVMKIEYQQYTNLWDSVGLFLDNTTENLDGDLNHQIVLGNYCGNLLMTIIQGKYQLIRTPRETKEYPLWLKIKIVGNGFEVFYALEDDIWALAASCEGFFDWKNENYIIGIFASMSERQYYKWLFNNFINICLNMNDASTLNYCAFIKRDCKNYTVNPLIRFSNEKISVLQRYGVDLWKFIKSNIDEKRYIEFWLNEKYIPELEAYNSRDYVHESLVYGYDDEECKIFMTSIYEGKPKNAAVKMKHFIEAYEAADPRTAGRFFLFELKPTNTPYVFDIQGIIRQLKDYIEGKNPTLVYKRLMSEEVGVFGIKCYETLLNDSKAHEAFLKDKRMSYILHEHKKCMRDRVEYMICMGYLDKDDSIEIVDMINEIYVKSNLIMIMVMKYQGKKKEGLEDKIWTLMNKVYVLEQSCYKQLIRKLQEYVDKCCLN